VSEEFGDLAQTLANVDRLVHEPARLLVLTILHSVDSADFLYLQRETALTKGNLSSHLAKLENADYIEIEKTYRGKLPLTICHLSDKGREAFEAYLAQIKSLVEMTE
jgi:DNA-binding MarR family transcriptional regulator